jgi:hypothetical protein
MKRDLKFERKILLKIEEHPNNDFIPPETFINDEQNKASVAYHLQLLSDDQYIEIKDYSTFGNGDNIYVLRMTSSGCEYLDRLRYPKLTFFLSSAKMTIAGLTEAFKLYLSLIGGK